MRKFELITLTAATVFAIGFLFFLQTKGNLFLLTMTAVMGYYLIFGFLAVLGIPIRKMFKKKSYSDVNLATIIVAVLIGFGSFNLAAGITFKILFYPGDRTLILVSLMVLMLSFIICLILIAFQKLRRHMSLLTRTAILLTLGIAFYFMIPDYQFQRIKYRNHPEYLAKLADFEQHDWDGELRQEIQNMATEIQQSK